MIVNRRLALKQFVFISAGALLIPSCMQDKSKSAILLKNMTIDTDQEKLLAELTETIIPATTTPGAKDVSAHLFALTMLDDCYKKEDQQKFIRGLQQFEKTAHTTYSKSFTDCAIPEREALLTRMEANKQPAEDVSFFYFTLKRLTIQAYTSSKYYLTKVEVYELVPARYHGCVPVKKTRKKVA
jgi:Gluconate 2-dehydrogenase subunit 3